MDNGQLVRIEIGSEVYNGKTAAELVAHMRSEYNLGISAKSCRFDTNERFMEAMAKRLKAKRKLRLKFSGTTEEDKCFSFIRSLINARVAREIG